MAVLEGDRLVADAGCLGDRKIEIIVSAGKSAPPNPPGPEDGNIVDVLAPHEAIVPVIMSEILKRLPGRIGFDGIVACSGPLIRSRRSTQHGPLLEVGGTRTLEAK